MSHNNDNTEKIIVRIDPDLEELIPEYLKNRRKDIETIIRLLKDGVFEDFFDFEDIRILGHSMKGSGGGYGFDRIGEIGKSIEDAAKTKDRETIKSCVDELSSYLNRVEICF